MERLKFRAWDKNESRMIYSGTEQNDYPFAWMIHNSGIDIAEHDGTEWNYLKELIIMQFTGQYDKNGKEIYEGDILKGLDWDDEEYTTIVRLDDGAFVIDVPKCDYDYTVLGWAIGRDIAECEVIGNIYENLKKEIKEGKE